MSISSKISQFVVAGCIVFCLTTQHCMGSMRSDHNMQDGNINNQQIQNLNPQNQLLIKTSTGATIGALLGFSLAREVKGLVFFDQKSGQASSYIVDGDVVFVPLIASVGGAVLGGIVVVGCNTFKSWWYNRRLQSQIPEGKQTQLIRKGSDNPVLRFFVAGLSGTTAYLLSGAGVYLTEPGFWHDVVIGTHLGACSGAVYFLAAVVTSDLPETSLILGCPGMFSGTCGLCAVGGAMIGMYLGGIVGTGHVAFNALKAYWCNH